MYEVRVAGYFGNGINLPSPAMELFTMSIEMVIPDKPTLSYSTRENYWFSDLENGYIDLGPIYTSSST